MTHKYDTFLFLQIYHLFLSFLIFSSTTDISCFANSAASFFICFRTGRQDLTEEGLGFCQRTILSADVFVEYNRRRSTSVIKNILSLASSSDCCLYSLWPVLPSQSHFGMRVDIFELSSRTTSMVLFVAIVILQAVRSACRSSYTKDSWMSILPLGG